MGYWLISSGDIRQSAHLNRLYKYLIGGGPTDDKPTITLQTPRNPKEASNFMIIRVADIWSSYKEWRSRGAEFITEPKDHGIEIRCYIRDPDGYIIEVGQTTGGLNDIKMD
jgi:lactoylglutathione lyase